MSSAPCPRRLCEGAGCNRGPGVGGRVAGRRGAGPLHAAAWSFATATWCSGGFAWSSGAGCGNPLGRANGEPPPPSVPPCLCFRGHRVMVVVPRYGDYPEAVFTGVRQRYRVFDQHQEVAYFHAFIDGVDFVFLGEEKGPPRSVLGQGRGRRQLAPPAALQTTPATGTWATRSTTATGRISPSAAHCCARCVLIRGRGFVGYSGCSDRVARLGSWLP